MTRRGIRFRLLALATTLGTVAAILPATLWSPAHASAPLRDLVPADPRPEHPGEVASLRRQNSDTFLTRQGAYKAVIHPLPINYRGPTGKWRPIDDTLVTDRTAGFAWRNAANAYVAHFPRNLGTPMRIVRRTSWVSSALLGARALGNVAQSHVTYAGALGDTNVSYTTESDRVKENIVLLSAATPPSFSFQVRMSADLTAHQVSGNIDFDDAAGKTLFAFMAPTIQDAGGTTGSVRMSSTTAHGVLVVTITPDAKWLAAKNRAWPVTIDPTTLTLSPSPDCYITSASSASSFCSGTTLSVGYNGTNAYHSLLQFSNLTDAVPRDAVVWDAQLNVYATATTTGTRANIAAYPVSKAWTSAVTWNTYDGTRAWGTHGGDVGTPSASNDNADGCVCWALFDVTHIVDNWLLGSPANDGFLLKEQAENVNDVITLASTESGQNGPYLTVYYEPRLGQAPFYTFDRQRLTDRSDLGVQVSNGNLLSHSTDLHIQGTGLDLAVERYYNSLWCSCNNPSQGWFGRSWQISVGPDVWIDADYGQHEVVYSGPTHEQFVFDVGSNGQLTPPSGLNATLVKTDATHYKLTFNRTGLIYNFENFAFEWYHLTSEVDRNGNSIVFHYNGGNELASITDTHGRSVQVGVDTTHHVITSITDSNGPTTRTYTYGYDFTTDPYEPLLTSYTAPGNKVTYYGYNANEELNYIQDPRGKVTTIDYDTLKRVQDVIRVTNTTTGTGPTTTFSYSYPIPPHFNTTVTNPRSYGTVYTSDMQDKVTNVQDPFGHSRSEQYNANYDPTQITMANGTSDVWNFTYDNNNNLTGIQSPDSGSQSVVSFGYTDPAHPFYASSSADEQSHTTAYGLNGNGEISQATDANNNTTLAPRNSDGTIQSITDARNHTWNYGYTNQNLTSMTPPNTTYPATPLGAWSYTYDGLSRVKTATDGNGTTITYTYDVFDHVKTITYQGTDGSTVTISYTYDGDGNLATRTDPSGTYSFTYDALNRLTKKTFPDASFMTFGYDGAGNLTSYIDGGGTVTYGYDAANRLTSLTQPGGSQVTYAYDSDNNRIRSDFPGGMHELVAYDSSNRECRYAVIDYVDTTPLTCNNSGGLPNPAKIHEFYSYSTSTTGPCPTTTVQDTSLVQSEKDVISGDTTTYCYDALDRLIEAQTKNGSTVTDDRSWTYDPDGNRKSQTINGSVTNYAYNNANELCWSVATISAGTCPTSPPAGATTYTYDGNGNETGNSSGLSFIYNSLGQTTSVTPAGGSAVSMSYADLDQTERLSAGTSTFQSSSLGVQSRTNTTTGATDFYARESNQGLVSDTTAGKTYYYLTDRLGSIVGLTDPAGGLALTYSDDPWGQGLGTTVYTSNPGSPWRFASGYSDTANLYKFGTRYYQRQIGRWTQQDAVTGTVMNPMTLDRYLYVQDDPTNATDMTGKCNSTGVALSGVLGTNAGALFAILLPENPILGGVIGLVYTVVSVIVPAIVC